MPKQDTPTAPVEPNAVTLEELQNNLTTALAKQQEIAGNWASAQGDMASMLKAATEMTAAASAVSKAQRAVDNLLFEARTEERMAAAVELKGIVQTALANVDVKAATSIGLRGLIVRFNTEDGSFTVDVTSAEKPTTPRVKSENGNGTSKPRAHWTLNGETFSSAELLEQFGGEEGAKAIDKARNFQNYGLKFSPGYDREVKALAAKIGAVKGE